MQPNELRIGNLFIDTVGAYCQPGSIQKVSTIGINGVNHWQDMGASGCCPFEKMNSIVLNTEILKQLGFVEIQATQQGEYNGFKLNVLFVCCNFYRDASGNYDGFIFNFTQRRSIIIRYLHQIQNLYFVLKGEELPVIHLSHITLK